MSDRPWTIEVRTMPSRKGEPVDPYLGEEWMPVRKPAGIYRFRSEHDAEHAKGILEQAQPHGVFRTAIIAIGRKRRRI